MAEQKTLPNQQSVLDLISKVEPEEKRSDCLQLIGIMQLATGFEPTMWGPSIIGFGSFHYRYESGREGDSFLAGFSPRKQNITIYVTPGFGEYENLLEKLGKHKIGKGCLYIKRLSDVDEKILTKLITTSAKHGREMHH